jgi:hypothetical protein
VEDVVHRGLKSRGRVGEAERHHHELEVAMMGPERRLGNVVRVHAHLMVARPEVEFGEEARPMELIKELVDHRDRELVLERQGVKGAVVDAEAPHAVRLANEEHWH